MKLFLAGTKGEEKMIKKHRPMYILESFYYISDWQADYINKLQMFLLDSGAFTFMNSYKGKVDFEKYLKTYIDFINKYDVKYFFELDIDSVVGYQEVIRLRKLLEQGTGKRCIPVWHKSRGIEEYKKLCQEYDYIAIGGIVSKEIKAKEYKYFTYMTRYAHANQCKVHGLGFTGAKSVKYHFDSVDSTSWLSGARFGQLHKFDGKKIITLDTQRRRITKPKVANELNLVEWIKYQRYLNKLQ